MPSTALFLLWGDRKTLKRHSLSKLFKYIGLVCGVYGNICLFRFASSFFPVCKDLSACKDASGEGSLSSAVAVWMQRGEACGGPVCECGLPRFQGKVSPIPPISGASLRDFLGSLMLSIVGGTPSLCLSPLTSSTPPYPPPPSLSSFSSLPVTPRHLPSLASAQRYFGLHWLMDCSLLPNCLGCGPLRHVL